MSIFSEVKAASRLIQANESFGDRIAWTFMKFPNGTPFFRLDVESPFAALVAPRRRGWWLMVDVIGNGSGRELEIPLGPLTADPRVTIMELTRQLGMVAGLEFMAEHGSAGLALSRTAYDIALATLNWAFVGAAADFIGSELMRRFDAEGALPFLTQARDIYEQVGDPNLDEMKAKLLLAQLGAGQTVPSEDQSTEPLAADGAPDLVGAQYRYRKAADSGDAGAMYNLGNLLADRLDPPDLVGARHWYEKAADTGHANAMYNLGFLLADQLRPPDLVSARHWYEKAADAGDADAMVNLGMLLAGQLDPPDLGQAKE